MALYSAAERRFLSAVSQLAYANPFLPERIEHERAALGKEFIEGGVVWSASVADPEATYPNIERIQELLEPLLEKIRRRITAAESAEDLRIYEEPVHQFLYQRYYERIVAADGQWRFYREFAEDHHHFLQIPGCRLETGDQPAHVFACFRQIQRAFHHIFDNIIGNSLPAARLRAAAWQSIFTHDMRRYRRTLFARMRDFPTLITGASGTGKELVARAIAGSRYVPFDPTRMTFADPAGETFFPVNLAALSPALIESELFGHRRGSFTGAIGDRKGWLEACPPAGAVFLDELGELDLSIQVKLLRVIETRKFSMVGETAQRQFSGKLIAATNRDLAHEISAGRFREDLYYRLCADLIHTPSLSEQIADSPAVLHDLLLYMTRRAVGEEAERCLPEVEAWIAANLPRGYRWPGNYRELEQCVRNIVIRRSYRPVAETDNDYYARYRRAELTADEVLSHYCALAYNLTGSYEEAARRIGLDRRTVKARATSEPYPLQ